LTYDSSTNRSLSRVVGVLLTLLLTIVFLFFAFRKVDFSNAFSIISKSSLLVILLYVIVFFASHYARALRWKLMLNSVKKDISKNNLFGSVMVSYGVSCVVPRLGEVYRALFLGRWESISRTTVLGTIVVERIIDVAFFAFASLVSVSIYSGDLFKQISWLQTSLIVGFSLVFISVIMVLMLVRFQEKFAGWLVSIASKINRKLSEKLRTLFDTLIDGFGSIKNGKDAFGILLWSLTIMILYALNTYVGFYMINMHDNYQVTFTTAWIVMTISSFGVLIPTPGGTGSYHMLSIFVLTQVYNFDYDCSAAYAILTHFISYIGFVGSTIGILYFLNKQRLKQGLTKETFLSVLKSNPENK
jgi:glycosyltransferase 2 family protein